MTKFITVLVLLKFVFECTELECVGVYQYFRISVVLLNMHIPISFRTQASVSLRCEYCRCDASLSMKLT